MPTPDLIDRLASLVAEHYVFPELGATIAARLADAAAAGALADSDCESVSARLTEIAQSVNGDGHLRIRPRRPGALEGDEAWERHYAADAVRNAGGIRSVRRLDELTGVLEIAPYLSPVHLAEPFVRAAFSLLRGVDRLVVDLRQGRGGTPETVALICGYLLGREPVHLQDIVGRDGATRAYWTTPAAERLGDDVAICVLTSASTFSGCEELAYNLQSLQRATVVGERTGGGAHPVEIFALDDVLEVTVPVARSVNAVTRANWEQIGVGPDIECTAPAAAALALEHLGTPSSSAVE